MEKQFLRLVRRRRRRTTKLKRLGRVSRVELANVTKSRGRFGRRTLQARSVRPPRTSSAEKAKRFKMSTLKRARTKKKEKGAKFKFLFDKLNKIKTGFQSSSFFGFSVSVSASDSFSPFSESARNSLHFIYCSILT